MTPAARAEVIRAMAAAIGTQGGGSTWLPMFVVQKRCRVYGFDPDWSVDCVWRHCDGSEADPEEHARLKALDDAGEDIPEDWHHTGYQDTWEFAQPFFTRAGTEAYIEENRHRMEEPRVYVVSGYRNPEWEAIRALLSSMADVAPPTAPPSAGEADGDVTLHPAVSR